MNNRYQIEELDNGLIRVFDRFTYLSCCFNPDGTYRHGALSRGAAQAVAAYLA
jgi:hypothetical protein